MTYLRKQAKGRECQARVTINETHHHASETVVLHHCTNKPLFHKGVGQKPSDIFGAYVCAICHDAIESPQSYGLTQTQARLDEYEAIFRTQQILLEEGKIKIEEL